MSANKAGISSIAAKFAGTTTHQPRGRSMSKRVEGHIADILALPSIATSLPQDCDPDSPTFGQLVWMLDLVPFAE